MAEKSQKVKQEEELQKIERVYNAEYKIWLETNEGGSKTDFINWMVRDEAKGQIVLNKVFKTNTKTNV